MSEPSICVGCRHAKWKRDKIGRLHSTGAGTCGAIEGGLRLPVSFRLRVDTPLLGGWISRWKRSTFRYIACSFKETAP